MYINLFNTATFVCLYIYFKMVDRFIDTGGIVHDHRLNKLSLHNVLLLEMTFRHGYCLFVLYPHPSDLSMSVGNKKILCGLSHLMVQVFYH